MILRSWRFQDLLKIAELEKECFPNEPWSYAQLVSSFQCDTFFGVVVEEDEEIIGYGGITVAADTADVANVAVCETYRRGGVGSAILRELIKLAGDNGAVNVFLEVRVSNSDAMRLYLKNGFCGVYARNRYYSDGEDCLVMKKIL